MKIYNFKMLVIADAGRIDKDIENFKAIDGDTSLGGEIVSIHEDEESQYIQLKNCEYVGTFLDFELGCIMGFKWDPERINEGVVAVDFTDDDLSLKGFKTIRNMADLVSQNICHYDEEEAEYIMAMCWNNLKALIKTERQRKLGVKK